MPMTSSFCHKPRRQYDLSNRAGVRQLIFSRVWEDVYDFIR